MKKKKEQQKERRFAVVVPSRRIDRNSLRKFGKNMLAKYPEIPRTVPASNA